MSLPLIYRIFGLLNLVMGLVLFFGISSMYATNGWGEFAGLVVVPVTTMAEHYGSHVFVLGVISIMIPSWMQEEQLKTAEQELEELYIKEDKAYVIRFQRIADKERMVVVFKKQSEADMYAYNIKKQGGKVFSNKLEKIPYKVVDRKSK